MAIYMKYIMYATNEIQVFVCVLLTLLCIHEPHNKGHFFGSNLFLAKIVNEKLEIK